MNKTERMYLIIGASLSIFNFLVWLADHVR